jgi:hypothetical protein
MKKLIWNNIARRKNQAILTVLIIGHTVKMSKRMIAGNR